MLRGNCKSRTLEGISGSLFLLELPLSINVSVDDRTSLYVDGTLIIDNVGGWNVLHGAVIPSDTQVSRPPNRPAHICSLNHRDGIE